jgi:hypothetical protein
MGKTQKIPYLGEVMFYILKVVLLFLILDYFISETSFYNQSLILIVSVFFSFSFNPFYLFMITSSYLISFWISKFGIGGDLGLLFIYLFAVLLNTSFMIIYLKFKYNFK